MNWIRPPGPVSQGLRIGLLGGSFNPAHGGHLYVSEVALKRLKLDYVWWLVSPGNPLKPARGMAAFAERLKGAEALARHPRIIVSGMEKEMGTRFTADTVAALQRRFAPVHFIWLMGSDNLAGFDRWRNWQDIAAAIPIAVVQRPGSILARHNSALVRRFGTVRNLRDLTVPPAVMVLDGRRNRQSATALRAAW